MILAPVASRRREERATRSLELLAIVDRLGITARNYIMGQGGDCRLLTQATMDYQARKTAALKAEQFRLRYGRDYMTGRRRHIRQRDTWWNQGYQDDADGSILHRQPDAWPRKRWVAYCLGVEASQADGRRARR